MLISLRREGERVPVARAPLWVIRCKFGADRLSTNLVRFASTPTVNSGLWDLSPCANSKTLCSAASRG